MREWIRTSLTLPLKELWVTANRKLTGHYAYFNVSDNWPMVMEFRKRTMQALWWGLNRRSQKKGFRWEEFLAYVDRHTLATPRRVVNLNPGRTA